MQRGYGLPMQFLGCEKLKTSYALKRLGEKLLWQERKCLCVIDAGSKDSVANL